MIIKFFPLLFDIIAECTSDKIAATESIQFDGRAVSLGSAVVQTPAPHTSPSPSPGQAAPKTPPSSVGKTITTDNNPTDTTSLLSDHSPQLSPTIPPLAPTTTQGASSTTVASGMAPPPPDSPQQELAPRKRRRKRDDPQSCTIAATTTTTTTTNSEVRAVISFQTKRRTLLFIINIRTH